MELPLVNESSFTPANPPSYSLENFLPLGNGISDHTRVLRLTMRSSEQTMGVVMDSAGNREEESTVTDQSMIPGGGRRKRMSNDSSKIASTCDAEQLMNSSLKRVKLLELKEENKSLKNEEDGTSATGGKHAEQNIIVPEPPKQDYIHVRARRGQATDSHSLAERARREKISERMKFLQDLVPGCNKVVGKALVLDEIINYVQSLQHQVEFLSMKLEAVNASIIPKDKMLPAKDDLTMWG